MRTQQRLDHGRKQEIGISQAADTVARSPARDGTDLQSERAKQAPDRLFIGGDRANHDLPGRRQRPKPLAARGLQMDALNQPLRTLGQPAGVIAIRLNRHRGQRGLHIEVVAGFRTSS
jgi:hypothetical protein